MRDALTAAHFRAQRGTDFRIVVGDGTALPADLVEVTELPSVAAPGARTSFSLLFRPPPGPALPQAIYRLENDGLGALDVFLVPIKADQDGVLYEAVFG